MRHAARTDPKYSRASSRKTPALPSSGYDELVTLRYVRVADSEENARDFPPSSRCRELNPRDLRKSTRSYFSSFLFFFVFLLFFFYGWSINFRPDVTVCINDYNQQVFFSSFQPARGGGSY